MAILNVPDKQITMSGPKAIAEYLLQHGIRYERWDVAGRIERSASSKEILKVYEPEIEQLKQRGGYVTADVISVNPETPGLDQMLSKFNKEHTHSEDEVRFVVDGAGIFHINPDGGDVFSVEMEAGDLINVPAGTRHWFNLCTSKTIKTIRLFKDMSGWSPIYLENGVDVRYEPLCFGARSVAEGQSFESKVSL
jgi:1,2-dihydroxy-3-keto-5-methylthiopentene dioxygenase